jgi:hypothetical protein
LFIHIFCGVDQSVQWGCAGLSQGAEEYFMMLGSHLFGLRKVSQACLEPAASGGASAGADGSSDMGVAAYLFSQYILVWRSLLQAMGSEF